MIFTGQVELKFVLPIKLGQVCMLCYLEGLPEVKNTVQKIAFALRIFTA